MLFLSLTPAQYVSWRFLTCKRPLQSVAGAQPAQRALRNCPPPEKSGVGTREPCFGNRGRGWAFGRLADHPSCLREKVCTWPHYHGQSHPRSGASPMSDFENQEPSHSQDFGRKIDGFRFLVYLVALFLIYQGNPSISHLFFPIYFPYFIWSAWWFNHLPGPSISHIFSHLFPLFPHDKLFEREGVHGVHRYQEKIQFVSYKEARALWALGPDAILLFAFLGSLCFPPSRHFCCCWGSNSSLVMGPVYHTLHWPSRLATCPVILLEMSHTSFISSASLAS